MKFIKDFTINSQRIKVEMVNELPNQDMGQFDCIHNTIRIATHVRDDDHELVTLTNEQILNTYFHEVLHAFQWYSSGDTDEVQSCTYAGYIIEFLKSSKILEVI